MKYLDYNLGNIEKGSVVEIMLEGNAANVRLLDTPNFNNYRKGKAYRYIGGIAKKPIIHLATTHSGFWHVVIDMQGLRGQVNASVRVVA